MYRISIVDDEGAACVRLESMITDYGQKNGYEYELSRYGSAEEYLAAGDDDSDIIFLDIDMPGVSGLDLAKKIRETRDDVILIFCTNLQQFALNGYEVEALGFIVKPVGQYSFDLFMNKAMRRLSNSSIVAGAGSIHLKTVGSRLLVNVKDIGYVEVRRHKLYYHIYKKDGSAEEVIQVRGSMQEAESKLAQYGFARCSIGYLVNLSHITSIKGSEVYLPQTILSVSRNYRKPFMEAFMRRLASGEIGVKQ